MKVKYIDYKDLSDEERRALKAIDDSTFGLVGIGGFLIVLSVYVTDDYLVAALGTAIAACSLYVRWIKDPMAAIGIVASGGITSAISLVRLLVGSGSSAIISPSLLGERDFGSFMLSVVVLWFGVRCYKAALLIQRSNTLQKGRHEEGG